PKDGSVTHVAVDGSPTQIRPDGGELPLSILPGQHTVSIGWRSQQGESPASSPDAVDLRAPSGNVTTSIALPADRWPLMALGAGVGPAFLYWGELLVFIVVARLLGRWHLRPVPRPHCLGAAAPGGLQPPPVGLPRAHVRLGTMGGAGPGSLASFRVAGMEQRGVLARRGSDAPGGPLSFTPVLLGRVRRFEVIKIR